MKAFLLLFLVALFPCLSAEEETAPVNTRVCAYSLPVPESEQTEEPGDTIMDVASTDAQAQEVDVALSEEEEEQQLIQAKRIAKFFYPGCCNRYTHYFFGPTLYQTGMDRFEPFEVGSYVVLTNGSVWKMSDSDFWRISGWTTSDRLHVTRNPRHRSAYPFMLRNLANGETIRVIVRAGPRYDSPLYCSCVRHDIASGYVWCNNGTVWYVSELDRAILMTWHGSDVVMIGVNEDSMRLVYPHLLMNLTNGSCCRASWIP